VERGIMKGASRRSTDPAGDPTQYSFRIPQTLIAAPEDGPFAFLTGVLSLLLWRCTGSEDIVAAGRNCSDPTFPLHVNLRDDPTFPELLERVRHSIQSGGTVAPPSGALLMLDGPAQSADRDQYDLIFAFTQSEDGFEGICQINGDRFAYAQAASLARHFETLAGQVSASSTGRISGFEMLDAAETHRILVEWNGEDRTYPEYCIHELIEQQAERTPEAIALVFGERCLTYGELNCEANQLAHYLQKKGAGRDTPVGVLMEASLECIIAVIAILKTGAAYLALDHRQPPHRLREIVMESRIALAVTLTSTDGHAAIAGDVDLVFVDREAGGIALESNSNPRSGVTPDDLALVRYTSGSTGKPKGAMSVHRSITSRLSSLPLPDFVPADICLLNTSWGFGTKLFYPLALGATVVVLPDDCVRNANRLAENIERHRITTLFMVPSQLRQLLSLGPDLSGRLSRLRNVTTGGEMLTADLAARFRELLPQAQLLNTYGGSEVGGIVTLQIVGEGSFAEGNSIGRPVVNTRVYLLNRDLRPVPPGTAGEICVASGHMGRGYLNRPDLTEPRFVPNPFGPGQLCRTGDLGRHFADGRIEFLGRADRQVKVRGFRVELEEVEAILQDHDQVDQAVVLAKKTGADNRLIGYIVFKPGPRPGVSELQKFMRRRVREYMVPYVFVSLDEMPLNARGKVDWQALPEPGRERPDVITDYEVPGSPLESAIAEIWSGVLGLDAVGIHDNFIELGGDSLLATAVSARLRNRLDLDVPMELVLEWSIATIARETQISGEAQ
jgi:amino acid adenylation domain-containing protein